MNPMFGPLQIKKNCHGSLSIGTGIKLFVLNWNEINLIYRALAIKDEEEEGVKRTEYFEEIFGNVIIYYQIKHFL